MSKIFHEYFSSHRTSGQCLLRVRLWFYSLIYCLMIFMAFILIQIDFTTAKDPIVRLYHYNRWLLITSWFNLISLVYTPICIYCDWRELRRTGDVKHVKILNKIRFLCFSSILFPTTCFSDILFWRLWIKDRNLLAPPAVHELVPLWQQHCLHSASLVVVILDLLLVPRRRPKNLTLGAMILTLFLAVYAIICGRSIISNEHIYPLLRQFSGYNYIPLVIFVNVKHFFYFTIQWLAVDLVWSRNTKTHALIYLITSFQMEIGEAKLATSKRKSRIHSMRQSSDTNKMKIS